MESPNNIESISSFREASRNIKKGKLLSNAYKIFKPVYKLLNVNTDEIEITIQKLSEQVAQVEQILTIPDRFNKLFSSRGWIAYDLLNVEVAKSVVFKAEAGDFDGAEADLVEHYSPENIRWLLQMCGAIKSFHPRMDLARKALNDYEEERYYACVPVILALLDGLVNDVGKNNRGFFATGANLQAWDSIAAHNTGLRELARIFTRERTVTSTESLTIPYRNGILHGMDLGYGNKMVAAKSWAALFAVREWALKAEKGLLQEPPKKPDTSWKEIIQQLHENADDKARLKAWTPRIISLDTNIPISGEPENYELGSAERKVVDFLSAWKRCKYGLMVQCLRNEYKGHINKIAGELRNHYDGKILKEFKILEISETPAITIVKVKLLYEEQGSEREAFWDLRLVNENAKGKAVIRGKPGSEWCLYTYYL